MMDCIDCHNTVGHPISPTAERAVDNAIAAGQISRELPFARREGGPAGQSVVSQPGRSADAAIDEGLRAFYQIAGRLERSDRAESRGVAAFQDVYRRNVFPTMKVTWGSYPDNKGHVTSTGCFRCHDDSHTRQGRDDDQRRLRILPQTARVSADAESCV